MSIQHLDTATYVSCDLLTSFDIPYPSNLAIGDLVLVFARASASTSLGAFTGFTSLGLVSVVSGSATYVRYRVIDGTEGATFNYNHGSDTRLIAHLFRVSGWEGTSAGLVFGGSGDTLDPPTVTAPNASATTAWIAALSWQSAADTITGFPANYTNTLQNACTNGPSTKPAMGFGFRETVAGSENPAAFTMSAAPTAPAAMTVGIELASSVRYGFRLTGIKKPNVSDELETGVSTARVRVWLDGDDTVAPSFPAIVNQSITAGEMEVELPSGSPSDSPVVEVDWGTNFFRTTATIVDLDDVSSGP